MTTIIRASDPAEFLGLVPALAGFTPRQSLVLLPFRESRTQGTLRIDLPSADVDIEEFADVALRTLLQVHGVDAVAIVVYCDDDPQAVPDGLLLPHLVTVEAVGVVCADAGLRIIDALCVTPSGWSDYLDADPEVRALSPGDALLDVPGLGDVSGDQLAGVELPASDLVDRERVGRALRDLEAEIDRLQDQRRPGAADNPVAILAAEAVLDDLPLFAEDLLDAPDSESAYRCAALLWCLSRPALRDAIVVQWATDLDFGYRALHAQSAFANGTPIPDAVGDVFLGRGELPDLDRLRCALEVVRSAASRAPRQAKAGALTTAAWLSWAMGRSSHAGVYVDAALQIEPTHSLASLISTMLAAAMLPEWVLRGA